MALYSLEQKVIMSSHQNLKSVLIYFQFVEIGPKTPSLLVMPKYKESILDICILPPTKQNKLRLLP